MSTIYTPTRGPSDWQWLLAQPGRQWKHEFSAMALAYAWERDSTEPWPPAVSTALHAAGLTDIELLLAIPEHQTPLPGGSTASQTDLLVLARDSHGLLVIAVEGKVSEPFGDQTVSAWRQDGSPGKQERLAYLLDLLGLPDDDRTAALQYQLLHRTAAAVIEAGRFGADRAIMLVHSFSATAEHFDAYAAFAEALGAPAASGTIAPTSRPNLMLGWVSDTVPAAPETLSFTDRFDAALTLARDLHATQTRKGTDIPYIGHLLGVASLVIEDGGTEDEAIAALLHDAVEDQGGQPTLKRIRQQFGSTVADIVEACSDTDIVPKPPWKERKEAYIAHLQTAAEQTLRVSLADKLHNARSILFDLHTVGDALWDRFNASADETIWYYRALTDAFAARNAGPMVDELRRTVDAIEQQRA